MTSCITLRNMRLHGGMEFTTLRLSLFVLDIHLFSTMMLKRIWYQFHLAIILGSP